MRSSAFSPFATRTPYFSRFSCSFRNNCARQPVGPQKVLRVFYRADPQRDYPGRILPGPFSSLFPGVSVPDTKTSKTSNRSRSPHISKSFNAAAPPTVKQHMAAIRMLFCWLTEKGVLAMNPAREVKTERFSRAEGKTPAFVEGEVQKLLGAIETTARTRASAIALCSGSLLTRSPGSAP
jgi:hypothetical protein